jgi:hypothetical protein
MIMAPIRNALLFLVAAATLAAGFNACLGDSPTLSITTSNNNVIITWPAQTSSNLVLIETPGLDHVVYSSNDVIYVEVYPRKIVSRSNYLTNGSNISVTVSVDSTSKFYLLQKDNFGPPPF